MRLLNRVLAALLSLALVVAGTLLIIEVIADPINHRPALLHWHRAYRWLARTPWQQGSVRVTCIVLLVAGLVLLAAELKRPRVKRLKLDPRPDAESIDAESIDAASIDAASIDAASIDAAYTRRGVAAAIRSAVTEVDGVRSAKVSVTRRRVRVSAATSARDKHSAQQLRDPARAAAQRRLDELALASKPSLRLTATARSS